MKFFRNLKYFQICVARVFTLDDSTRKKNIQKKAVNSSIKYYLQLRDTHT